MNLLQIHVALSLIGIATGLVALYGLLTNRFLKTWTAVFLVTTVLTSVTGFPLPPFGFDPPRAVGIISLILLAVAIIAVYGFHLRGHWRWLYLTTGIAALYLNVFVGVVQTFQKVVFFQTLAPTQTEAPFLIAQAAALIAFILFGLFAVRTFRPLG
ncbi:hypothetical protein BH10PSE7_BH10PSE7_24740 [soil metagenome]